MLKQELSSSKERLFICPCAKSYFSYAALFTHVKQKHDGKAPGPIIKPKTENKRGRPRKQQPLPQSSFSSFQEPRKSGRSGSNESGQQNRFNSSIDLNQNMGDLKCSPSSKFTLYKRDSFQIPTTSSLVVDQSYQEELLKDLSRYLEILPQAAVPEDLVSRINAAQYLITAQHAENKTISYLQRFLSVCRSGLKGETFSQLFLLLAMLLQHISEQQALESMQDMSISSIHKHVVSFFQYIKSTSREIDLTPYSIFNDLNTIKSLIVFFNWLSKHQQLDSSKKSEDSQSQIQ